MKSRPRIVRALSDTANKAVAATLAVLVVGTPLTPYVARADDDDRPRASAPSASIPTDESALYEVPAEIAEGLTAEELTELETAIEEGRVDPSTLEAIGSGEAPDESIEPVSLPGGETRDTVASTAISLPTAEGSVEGMGESFAPILSSGTATFSVPIAVAPGRAGVQPSLSLAYASSGGNGACGFGWGLAVPFISRQTDRGLPRYDDREVWHPNEDRFIYNGGQELVPVSSSEMAAIEASAAGSGDPSAVPADVATWQQYRARVEGGFMRFFRARDSRHWVVQSPDGTRFDFGVIATGASDVVGTDTSLELDDRGEGHVFRWMLTRMSDAHGSTIYYTYRRDRGQLYIDNIHYLSPGACGGGDSDDRRNCAQPLSAYGARVHFVYDPSSRQDVFTTYTSGYPISTAWRLRRVEVTSREPGAASRSLVRRYHLTYAPNTFHSLLESVRVEGRPSNPYAPWGVERGDATVTESSLGDAIVGALLPPMRFGYSTLPTSGSDVIPGFGALSSRTLDVRNSPPSSIDEARSELYDVNSDGLLDILVTDPARYRTASGAPAAGVFFNGFTGEGADPAPRAAGVGPSFSDAVPVPMPSDLSGTMNLGNLNIVPMDVDGDGRGDLLHMPRLATYGWFTPTRAADSPTAAPAASPADQGWRFSYAEISLPRGELDPRIDFGRDGEHLETLDVNGDHLIDVVRTTGTVMQTWLNLGWLEGGEGRFGTYTIADDGTPSLSTLPLESCLLQSGLPIDFEDPEVRFADMNADGIVDIVRMRRGRVQYWPGRGEGSWGTGPRECPRGSGDLRYVEMTSPPPDLDIDLAGVQLADVDGDGASDIVQVGFDRVYVWFNRAGSSWTARAIIRGTPYAPAFAPRVRLVDIDASGTLDIVYGNGERWEYVDLLESRPPRMLTTVDNGLGALTTIEYGSSADDYLADLDAAVRNEATGAETFTWARITGEPSERLLELTGTPRPAPGAPPPPLFRAAGTPIVSTVVRRVRTSDRLDALGGGLTAQTSETAFAYHDGYYEGIEQEFRGFGAADSETLGDVDSPSVLTRTWFHQGRRPSDIADDRLAWNPDEALKGREYLTEVFDRDNRFLSTSHATLTTRTLGYGLDGRPIQYAFVSEASELRYDTTPFTPLGTGLALPSVTREVVSAGGTVTTSGTDPPRTIAIRGARAARVRTTFDSVDNLGHVLQQTAHGRVIVDGMAGATDDPIVSHSTPRLLPGSGWIWRTDSSFGTGTGAFDGSTRYGETANAYDADGDLIGSTTTVTLPRTYTFAGESGGDHPAGGFTQTAEPIVASSVLDVWGQALASCAGHDMGELTSVPGSPPARCLRYAVVSREAEYAQLVTEETVFTSASETLTVRADWDRGLGVLLSMTDPNTLVTRVGYDGLGRMTALVPPPVQGCPADVPATRIRYELTTSPASQPLSRVVTTTELDCDSSFGEDGDSLTSIGYVDGLGRARAALATGDTASEWIRAGLTRFDKKGEVVEAWQPDFYSGSPTAYASVLAPSLSIPSARSTYDAFGRARFVFAEDASLTVTSYHALSTDVCDALDNDPSSLHYGTCTTARTDGHGRLIDQILRNREPGSGVTTPERHRLWTYYRADGAVAALVRSRTADEDVPPTYANAVTSANPHVSRTFFYDSVGRRIGSDDPDTDNYASTDPASRTWRYLFNRVGDLVAVRDPRGCGQNFVYDLGGRLLGEQYVGCGEAQSTLAEQPVEEVLAGTGVTMDVTSTDLWVDVRYFYDENPDWVSALVGIAVPTVSGTLGRATGVSDRGQRSGVAYDQRGNAIWTVRQMAVISAPLALSTGIDPTFRPFGIEGGASSGTVTYDDAEASHTYVRTATFDHAGRPTAMTLPADPDWSGMGAAPVIGGTLTYTHRGLPAAATLTIDAATYTVVSAIEYLRDGLVSHIEYGDGMAPAVVSDTEYDIRRRPVRMTSTRTPSGMGMTGATLSAVSIIHDQRLEWDAASNLTALIDERDPTEWPDSFRPQSVEIEHDSLYRVVSAMFHYSTEAGDDEDDTGSDWRSEAASSNSVDPMRPEPAPMVVDTPPTRVRNLTWDWDWLGNMEEWTDDAQAFYERSIGDIENGYDISVSAASTPARPSALYVASNLPATPVGMTTDEGGWVELSYGVGGNVTSMTVHAQCTAALGNVECREGIPGPAGVEHAVEFSCEWSCALEQHYEYRWDELDRIAEARRWDRAGGHAGTWSLEARQRYRYDGANQRTVKESFDTSTGESRVALYVYPGDFERRGLERGMATYDEPAGGYDTETQYLVAGARLVWQPVLGSSGSVQREQRLTMGVTDLLGTTAASVDLLSGELLEVSTYYPNGARETLWAEHDGGPVPLEPMGFTGKEADEEVGLVYFGERYLIARVGRWASPDPLHVHASGGGEALNSYHYVGGNLLQASDPFGLDGDDTAAGGPDVYYVNTRPADLPEGHNEWTYETQDMDPGIAEAIERGTWHNPPTVVGDLRAYAAEHGLPVYVYDANADMSFEDARTMAGILRATDATLDRNDAAIRAALGPLVRASSGIPGTAETMAEIGAAGATGGPLGLALYATSEVVSEVAEAAGADEETADAIGLATTLSIGIFSMASARPNTGPLRADAAALHGGTLDPVAARMRTTAVLGTRSGLRIAGAGARADLTPAQRAEALRRGMWSSRSPRAHAEPTTLREAEVLGETPAAIVVTRAFCPACRELLVESGATIVDDTTAIW